VSPPTPSPITRPISKSATNSLFNLALNEVQTLSADSAFELNSEQVFDPRQFEQAQALFNLAAEVIKNPNLEQELVDRMRRSDERQVEAKGLSQILGAIEKKISSPVLGLKTKIEAARAKADIQEAEEKVKELQPGNIIQRLFATSVDFGLSIAIALIITLAALRLSQGKDAFSVLLEEDSRDWALLLSVWIAASVATYPAYLITALMRYRSSVGLSLARLRLVNEGFKKPRVSHYIVWSLSLPLCMLIGAELPTVFSKRGLAERIARTRVCKQARLG
jgi:uncharacterized RDD family membrane protein YckC